MEDDLLRRYPQQPADSATAGKSFRNYAAEARPSVKKFYELNHRFQTFDFVQSKRAQYLTLDKREMGIWEAMEYLNTLIDDSDPDIDLPQIEHLLQTAEAIRKAGRPRWYILTGLIHDLGKICACGMNRSGQWSVIPFRWDANSLTRLFLPKRLHRTLISPTQPTRLRSVFIKSTADWTMCICLGATTNTCIMSLRITYRRPRST